MRVVKITAEEYDALQKAGAWVHWRNVLAGDDAPRVAWDCAVSRIEDFWEGLHNIEFYTRLDDEQDVSHGDEASTY